MDVLLGPYTLKCIYHTTLTLVRLTQGRQTNRHRRGMLVIQEVDISLLDLLNWRCGCPNPKPCAVQTLLVRPHNEPGRGLRGCVVRLDHPNYRHAFLYFPCSDRVEWKARVAALGELERRHRSVKRFNRTELYSGLKLTDH